jgi:predicted SAM-dependent methyltransferase
MRTLLHVGCSSQDKTGLKGFDSDDWSEIRFDIDPSVYPDIEGTLTDMDAVATESVDAIYSAHNIEHVFPHEVHTVLLEFHRVLKPDGIVVLTCPDLVSVCTIRQRDRLHP